MTDDQLPEIEAAPPASDDELRTVTTLLRRQLDQQREVARLTTELKEAERLLHQTSTLDLPEALTAVGYAPPTRTTIAGHQVEFTEKFRCGQLSDQPTKDNPANHAGLAWLTEHGHGDLARREVTAALGKDSDETANEIIEWLRNHHAANQMKITSKSTVPWNTLAAFVKEQVDAGTDIPLDTLKVHRIKQVKVS